MRIFERRQNSAPYIRRFVVRSIAALALFVVMLFSAHGAWGMYVRFAEAQQEGSEAQERLQSLSQRKEEVAAAVSALSTNRGIEAEVRERYGVAKPGEGKIEIVRNEAQAATTTPADSGNIFTRMLKSLLVW